MKRILVVLVATLAAWLGTGALAPAIAIAANDEGAPIHDYDGGFMSATSTCAISERAPPASHDHTSCPYAVAARSHVASARPDGPTPGEASTYDDLQMLARATSVTTTPSSQGGVSRADLSAPERTGVAANGLAGLSRSEQAIAGNARTIYGSDALGEIRAAHSAGRSAEVSVGGTTIVYEPGLSASGMTLFGENGFVIGRGAFASDAELAKTIAHESYRLATSQSAGGVGAGLAKAETDAAFNFAEQVGPYVMGGP